MTSALPNRCAYILVVDDHPLVARGLAHFIQSSCPGLEVAQAVSWTHAQTLIQAQGSPTLLIIDVWLSEGSSLEAMRQWSHSYPATPWLAISGDDDSDLARRALAAGARGFVHKQTSPDRFVQALQAVMSGGTWFDTPAPIGSPYGLTPRQGEILSLLLRGLPNKRIASELGITEATVKEHVTAILARLGVRSRVEAITALRARRPGTPSLRA